MVDSFTSVTGVYASYCNSCKIWQVNCPECNQNWCGSGCKCGYDTLMERKQAQLEELLEKFDIEK